jgi:hypothetical protein
LSPYSLFITAFSMIFSRKRGRGRPKMAGCGEGTMVRFHHNGLLDQVDAWIAKQDDVPSRSEPIRRPVAKALGKGKNMMRRVATDAATHHY